MKKSVQAGLRPPWAWALAGGLIGLLAVTIAAAPARWLSAGVAKVTAGTIQLQDAQGSVWTGSARLVLSGGAGSQGSASLPGRLHWQLGLSGLGLAAVVSADCCTAQAPLKLKVSPRWGGASLSVADGRSQWPANALTGLGTPWNTVQLQGELTLDTRGLSVEWLAGRVTMEGGVDITARHLSSRLSTLQPLGSYRMTLAGGDTPSLNVSTLEGALRLSGQGRWVGSRLRFSGEASAASGMEVQLANLLNILGRRQGDKAIISLG